MPESSRKPVDPAAVESTPALAESREPRAAVTPVAPGAARTALIYNQESTPCRLPSLATLRHIW